MEHHTRGGEETLHAFAHTDGTRTGTAATMRRGESLVEIDVHHIESHVAGAAIAQHGVEVGSVVVHQSAAVVDQFRNFRNVLFEDAECVRVGHHHGSNAVALFFY